LSDGKEKHFAQAYENFVTARDITLKMGLPEFASREFESSMDAMKHSYCNDYGFYIYSDKYNTECLDEFIRSAEVGVRYYIGGTLDYHY
jgi:hypothetical protein